MVDFRENVLNEGVNLDDRVDDTSLMLTSNDHEESAVNVDDADNVAVDGKVKDASSSSSKSKSRSKTRAAS